jgi:hypothetical protein
MDEVVLTVVIAVAAAFGTLGPQGCTLVGQMRANNPAMKIVLAQASAMSTARSPITVVDQWTVFGTADDTYDGVHPNASGDQKISDRWYPAVAAAASQWSATVGR